MPTALITGCSSGFGLEAVLAVARRGWDVVATMRNLDKRERLDKAVADAGLATRVTVARLDVTDVDSIRECVASCGPIDAVVNNAGMATGGAFEDLADDEFRKVMETNFFGVLDVTRAVLPGMRARRRGRIVIVSSVSAFHGSPAMSAYTASKWAVEGWAESIRYEVEPFGISVVLVQPGSYATDIWDSSVRTLPEDSPYGALAEPLEEYVDTKLVKRARDPREVGEAVAKALDAPNPRLRWPVGPDAWAVSLAHGLVPDRIQRWVVRRLTGLHKVKM